MSVQILQSPQSPKYHEECLIKPNKNQLLTRDNSQNCVLHKNNKYLEVENYLSEYDTAEKQALVRKNLGVNGYGRWGNIDGYLEDQQDLINYIEDNINELEEEVNQELEEITETCDVLNRSKVSIEIENQQDASKQIKYELGNEDFILNSDFNSALTAVLGDRTVESVDDAIRILMYKLFPIVYRDFDISVNEVKKTYTIEQGTSINVPSNTDIGTLQLTITEGNKGDTITSILVNNTQLVVNGQVTRNSIPIKASDITNQTNLNSTKTKNYTITLTTSSGYTKTITTTAQIQVNTFQKYFYETSDQALTGGTYTPTQNTISKQNNTNVYNECVFNLGTNIKYLTIISPRSINKLETAVGNNVDDVSSYYTSNGYEVSIVTYTPSGGTAQTYYRIKLKDPQSKYVKVKIT